MFLKLVVKSDVFARDVVTSLGELCLTAVDWLTHGPLALAGGKLGRP